MPDRLRCIVPFCNRTRRGNEQGEEWICDPHFRSIPRALRVEYNAAWHEAAKADRRAADGIEPNPAVYVRVTQAFDACKSAAIEAAGGIDA
ncbi:MAG: hypothetical protein J0I45_21875 [Bosea sp.]|nr:hypothetical protein [Bosea sp. (in: a-proteobacteria)]